MAIILTILLSIAVYIAGAILFVNGEIENKRKYQEYQAWLNMQAQLHENEKLRQSSMAPPVVNVPTYIPTKKETDEADKESARDWLRKNADFLVYQTEKPLNEKNERVFTIPGEMLKDLTEAQRRQVALLLLEGFVSEINEAVVDKQGNIVCYYYLG